jgi:hypothetical protein
MPFPSAPSALLRPRTPLRVSALGGEVRQDETMYQCFVFTSLTYLILFEQSYTVFRLTIRAGVRAGRPSRGSQWWVAAPASPPRRVGLPGGLASARRSRNDAGRRRRSCIIYPRSVLWRGRGREVAGLGCESCTYLKPSFAPPSHSRQQDPAQEQHQDSSGPQSRPPNST